MTRTILLSPKEENGRTTGVWYESYSHFGYSVSFGQTKNHFIIGGDWSPGAGTLSCVCPFNSVTYYGVQTWQGPPEWDGNSPQTYRFGNAVAITDRAEPFATVIGAPGTDNDKGAVYVSKGDIDYLTRITAEDGETLDNFGQAVAIDNNTFIVGASGHKDNKGAVYVYTRATNQSNEWTMAKKLMASDGQYDDGFGFAVDLQDDLIVVGAPNTTDGGRVYVYQCINNDWFEVAKFSGKDTTSNDSFGVAVSLENIGSRKSIAVGAPDHNNNEGAAYIFQGSSDANGKVADWVQIAKLTDPEPQTESAFGSTLGISNQQVAVGAHNGGADRQGVVYIFDTDGTLETIFAPEYANPDGGFGYSVDIQDGQVVIGQPSFSFDGSYYHKKDDETQDSGVAYTSPTLPTR